MDFRTTYPDYAEVEHLIRRAHAERSVAIAHLIAGAVEAATRGVRRLGQALAASIADYRSRHAADAGVFAPGPAHR